MPIIPPPAAPVAPAPAARRWSFEPVALGGLVAPPPEREPSVREPAGHLLSVQLPGQLKVRLDDVAVDHWLSGRGRSLFKYLVTHRDPWPRRELLMDAFWPEAAPAAARNRPHVALHSLRRGLRRRGAGAAEAPLLPRARPARGPQQPERGHAQPAPGLPGRRRRPAGDPGGRHLPA